MTMKDSPSVLVLGGGVIGSAVAYYAARRGLAVTLVDQPRRGCATSASAGGLWPVGESMGLGCGVIFFKALVAEGRIERDGLHGLDPLPPCFLDFSLESNAYFLHVPNRGRFTPNRSPRTRRKPRLCLLRIRRMSDESS